jgi:hypothetical protein
MEVFADIVDAGALRAPDLAGLLVGVNNGNDETLGLGLLEGVGDDGLIYLRTPVADVSHVQILQLGSMRLDQTVIAPRLRARSSMNYVTQRLSLPWKRNGHGLSLTADGLLAGRGLC